MISYQDFFFSQETNQQIGSKCLVVLCGRLGDTGKFSIFIFDETQADLNTGATNVRKELFNVVLIWRDKGVKGFRFDVITI